MVDFEAITISPLVQLGVAGLWLIYMIWKEKKNERFYEVIRTSIDNNTNAIEKLQFALEVDDGTKR